MDNMTITTTQKIIKIGTSKGVTIPAKQLLEMQLTEGDEVKVIIEPVHRQTTLGDDYTEFKKQYGETLKNLAER